jgi:DNA-binding PadR family transcriptional regulator
MSLRHALLALVESGPMTGYEIAKVFDRSVAYVWHAPHSQIYPELRRLESERLVVAHDVPRGRATKRAYTLTPAGAAELRRWVGEVQPPPRVREPAYLKATYYEYAPLSVARAQFAAHRAHYQEQQDRWERHVEQLEAGATDLLRRRLAHTPASAHEAVVAYKVHAYRGLIERARTEVAWATEGLALVDRLAAALPLDAPPYDPTP